MKTAKFRFVVVLFIVASLVAFISPSRGGADDEPILFPEGDIETITDLVLETDSPPFRIAPGYKADVYFPNVSAADDAFPIVAFLQGAAVDKIFYSRFGTELARYGFVVVIPNRTPVPFGPDPFPEEYLILDVLAQMKSEDETAEKDGERNPLFGIIDTNRMGLAGHSAGGAASLFAIDRSCQPPFCIPSSPLFTFFPLPDAVLAGAFYGTNTCGAGGDAGEDPACEDKDATPPNKKGEIYGINNENIPVALVQGTRDGISTPAEADATIKVIKGQSELIPIIDEKQGANHYGITDFPNAPFPFTDPNDTNTLEDSRKLIAQVTGEFLLEALTEGQLIPGEFPVSAKEKLDVDDEVIMNRRQVAKGKTEENSVIEIDANRDSVSQFLPDLVPSVFPENDSDLKIKVENDRSFESDTAVYFKEIEIKKGITASFSGGGPFHIDKLKVKKGAVLNLGAGTYFVNKYEEVDENSQLTLSSTPVELHIGDKFKAEKKRIVLNAGGSVDGLRVYLHEDAEFKAKEVDFTGLLYGPHSKKIEVEKATVKGAIIISGEVKLKKKADITYTETDQALVGLTVSLPE